MDLNHDEITLYIRECFGSDAQIIHIEPFRGGARKLVYFLDVMNPNLSCVLYVWNDETHYFTEREDAGFEDHQMDANAPRYFLTNIRYLLDNAISVPKLFHHGKLQSGHDFAVVERVKGQLLKSFLETQPDARAHVLEKASTEIRKLHGKQRHYRGTLLDEYAQKAPLSSEDTVNRALLELRVTAESYPSVAEKRDQIITRLNTLRDRLLPRGDYYTLLHGELAPHILVRDGDFQVYFVDIDGLHFGDLESEHTFLHWYYGDDAYAYFKRLDLDPARLAFYKLAMHISFVYAGSRFMLKDFHDQAFARYLFDRNWDAILAILENQ